MKIECTPKEAADLIEELRSRLKEFDMTLKLDSDDLEFIQNETTPTKELVDELMTREGVETTIAEPYEDVVVAANGPAMILKIID